MAVSASKTTRVSGVTPSHSKAGFAVSRSFTFRIILSDVSTLQMSYSRRTFVLSEPSSTTPAWWTRSERPACSSERTPPSAFERDACRKRPTNLTESSRIDFSFRPSFSAAFFCCAFSLPFAAGALPAAGSSRSGTIGSVVAVRSSAASAAGSLEMPSQRYAARSFCTISRLSSTLTMSYIRRRPTPSTGATASSSIRSESERAKWWMKLSQSRPSDLSFREPAGAPAPPSPASSSASAASTARSIGFSTAARWRLRRMSHAPFPPRDAPSGVGAIGVPATSCARSFWAAWE